MKGKISYIDQNHFLYEAVNILFSAVKLDILTWGVYGIDSLLEPASIYRGGGTRFLMTPASTNMASGFSAADERASVNEMSLLFCCKNGSG